MPNPNLIPAASATLSAPAVTRPVDLVVIHCSATPSGKAIAPPGKSPALVIDGWHAQRGFERQRAAAQAFNPSLPHIGYHYVIELTGEVFTGRSLSEVGAHAAGFNARSVGICLVGGAEREATYTLAQWDSLQKVVTMLLVQFDLPAAPARRVPSSGNQLGYTMFGGVCGHRDLSPDGNGNGLIERFEWLKTCPGFDVRAWLSNRMRPFASSIHQGAAV